MTDLEKVSAKLPLSESTKRLNPHLHCQMADDRAEAELIMGKNISGNRIRQFSKQLNKLEQEWFNILNVQNPSYPRPRAQAVRFRLCNGVHYTPDVFIPNWPWDLQIAMPTAFEVKGPKAWDDAIVKIKMAAHEWPDIRWILAWKENGQWKTQVILP